MTPMYSALSVLARCLPTSVVVRMARTFDARVVRPRAEEHGHEWVEPDIRGVIDRVSPLVRDRIDELGGVEAVEQRLKKSMELSDVIPMALFWKGRRALKRCVRLEGNESTDSARQPVVLVVPHVGPWPFVSSRQLLAARRVAVFGRIPTELFDLYAGGFLSMAPGIDAENLRYINGTTIAGLEGARQALKGGYDLLWHPDGAYYRHSSKGFAAIEFLGNRVVVPTTVSRLARMTHATVAVASATVDSYEPLHVTVRYVDVGSAEGTEIGAFTERIYGAVEKEVLRSLDQWSMLSRPDHAVGLLPAQDNVQ